MIILLSVLNIHECHVDVLKHSITLLLYSLWRMETFVAQNEVNESELANAIGLLEMAMKGWANKCIGVCFGKIVQHNTTKLLYGSVEFKVIYTCSKGFQHCLLRRCGKAYYHLKPHKIARVLIVG